MSFKYKENIEKTIATAILENEKQNTIGKTHYREIHRKVERILGYSISHNKLLKSLSDMVDVELTKDDPTQGKRGFKVFYALTDRAKKKYRLGILGTDEKIEKCKNLYQLLIFYEVYKRSNPISERKLHQFLRQIGSSKNDLKIIGKVNSLNGLDPGQSMIAFQPIKGIEIVRFDQPDFEKNIRTPTYYVVLPGFSVKEFIWYLELLKKHKAPRPFLRYSTAHEIPAVLHVEYSEQEVADAIDLLKNDGIIKSIGEVFPGELRYNIADESLKHLILGVWLIHLIDFQLVTVRIAREHKPTEADKKYLRIFLGNKGSDKFLAFAHGFRRNRGPINDEFKQAVKKLEERRALWIRTINEVHGRLIRENEVIAEIIEEVCSSPVFHMKAQNGS